jgi:hypothetical protein
MRPHVGGTEVFLKITSGRPGTRASRRGGPKRAAAVGGSNSGPLIATCRSAAPPRKLPRLEKHIVIVVSRREAPADQGRDPFMTGPSGSPPHGRRISPGACQENRGKPNSGMVPPLGWRAVAHQRCKRGCTRRLEAAPGFEPARRGHLEADESLPPDPTGRLASP